MPGKGRRERSTAAAAPTRRRACRRCGRRYRGTSRRRARAGRRRGPPRSCPPSRWPTQAARSGRPGSSARASPRRRRSAATSSRSCCATAARGGVGGRGGGHGQGLGRGPRAPQRGFRYLCRPRGGASGAAGGGAEQRPFPAVGPPHPRRGAGRLGEPGGPRERPGTPKADRVLGVWRRPWREQRRVRGIRLGPGGGEGALTRS
mmetsp:Transcript_16525/g.39208  ORF Transcript_16525/g.39208 Transcript_16525/m.39208 type:complete len:204 (+) Transcript_16525:318-929(+)